MTRRKKKHPTTPKPELPMPPGPIDVVDGIPDRQWSPARWKLLALAGVFVAWIAFLLYCQLAGAPPK